MSLPTSGDAPIGWLDPIVDMAFDSLGYVAVRRSGAVEVHGGIPFKGSLTDRVLPAAIGGIQIGARGLGYYIWLVDGTVFPFGEIPLP